MEESYEQNAHAHLVLSLLGQKRRKQMDTTLCKEKKNPHKKKERKKLRNLNFKTGWDKWQN